MSAMENTLAAAPGNEEQLQELHRTMKARARRKNRTQKGVLLTLNTFMAIFMMLPLLYAISVALMPANELNSMAMKPEITVFRLKLSRRWVMVCTMR